MELDSKYKNAMQIATICEVKAQKAKLKTNQPITEKEIKGELKPLEKEFLKEFSKEANKALENIEAQELETSAESKPKQSTQKR